MIFNMLGVLVSAIEWYDAAVCIAFSSVISNLFLPEMEKTYKFTLYLYFLSASYLGRPIGAYLFGGYSDKYDRLKAAYISFFLMVVSSLVIALLPTYNQVGFFAPLTFITMRFFQGIAIGGNYAISVYSIESSKNKYFASSLISVGIFLGFMFGSFVTSLFYKYFSISFINLYAWRISLIGSFLLSLPILIFFPKSSDNQKTEEKSSSFEFSFILFFKACFLLLLDMVPFYTLFVLLPNYKVEYLNFDPVIIWSQNSYSMFIIVLLTPLFGFLSDKYNPASFLKLSALMLIFSSLFYPWNGWFWSTFFGIMMAMCYGVLYGYLPLQFPKECRAKLSGLALNITATCSNFLLPSIGLCLSNHLYILGVLFTLIGTGIFAILINEK